MSIKSEFEIYRGTVDATRADILRPTRYEGWSHLLSIIPPKPRLAAEIMGLVFYLRERFVDQLSADARRNINSISLQPHTPGVDSI